MRPLQAAFMAAFFMEIFMGPALSKDLDVLGATVWAEARGEPDQGKLAVAWVAINRATYAAARSYPLFGDGSVRSACLKPWQFSCWNPRDPNAAQIEALDFAEPDPELASCIAIAKSAIERSAPDPTGGCMFYKVSSLPWPKDWGPEVPPDIVIGHQSFYRLGLTVPSHADTLAALTPAPPVVSQPTSHPTLWSRICAWFRRNDKGPQ